MNRFVVVGAGPAGLSVALQLARAGHPVALVEASRHFSRQFRGEALMPCGLEALAHLGLGNLHQQLPHRSLAGWSVWVEGRQLFHVAEPMGSLQPCTLVAQEALLEHLLELAQEQPRFRWLPGQAVKRLLQREGRISGVEFASGESLEADLVIGCDGRGSLLRRQAGLTLQSSGVGLELLWFKLPGPLPAELDGSFNTLLAGGQIGSACIGARGDLQLAWLLQADQDIPSAENPLWPERLAQLLPPAFAAVLRERGGELSPPQRVSVQVGMAKSWHTPGLLLLGDAAHPMSPVRAQGINMALRDGVVAGQRLSRAGSAEELDAAAAQVEQQRRPEIRRMQALQSAEARQGHLVGHNAVLRHSLAGLAPLIGPVASRIWRQRQGPLREGIPGALPQRTNSISW
ncbi:FAD-dependent oxidoreductase [Synechococcus sp. HK05]|uniref:FAD-dependent oxidoreductase n=1 Tax=Synechococcus sp. HK05 TaxID=2725975 RepID=UPI001C38802D|nr:FAD-dependent oxidoreductase [Synechococcus sp. HK05]MBV2351135.1 FAD-dependent oxidoreductase [Synechococcus sp. HK05]